MANGRNRICSGAFLIFISLVLPLEKSFLNDNLLDSVRDNTLAANIDNVHMGPGDFSIPATPSAWGPKEGHVQPDTTRRLFSMSSQLPNFVLLPPKPLKQFLTAFSLDYAKRLPVAAPSFCFSTLQLPKKSS